MVAIASTYSPLRRRSCAGVLLGAFLGVCPLAAHAAGPESSPLGAARTETIVQALLQREWDPTKIVAEKAVSQPKPPVDPEQVRLWQGNSPQVDIGFMDFVFNFLDGKGEAQRKLKFSLDMGPRYLRATYSDNLLPKFRGGAVFEDITDARVVRLFFPGGQSKGLLLFVPPLKRGDDFYLLACPRVVKVRNQNQLDLQNFEWKPDSMLFHVYGHVKARLLSGTSSGEIEASIEQSPGIPAPKEANDLARGRNPTVELIYRTASDDYPAQPIPESGERAERFLVNVDMRLPSGNRRKTTEGFSFWVKTVDVPEVEVAVPFRAVKLTGVAKLLSHDIRRMEDREGVSAVVNKGPCALLVGERSEPERILSAQPPVEAEADTEESTH